MREQPRNLLPQFRRYLLIGGFNTIFGYCLFALLNWAFSGLGTYNYMYASVLSTLISISLAFLLYKWLVFRTKGNYLVEWVRFFGVYGASLLFTFSGLPILVTILRRNLQKPEHAPYIANAILTVIIVLFSFFGHKRISFRPSKTPSDSDSSAKTPSRL